MKEFFKNIPKTRIGRFVIIILISIYIYIVRLTSKVNIVCNYDDLREGKVIFASWHEFLPFAAMTFEMIKKNIPQMKVHGIFSMHSDGKIMANYFEYRGFNTIEGSSNKNASAVVRQLISTLNLGEYIFITPDGPRGPARVINSDILRIGQKMNARICSVAVKCKKVKRAKSWDAMIIPMPFNVITITITKPIDCKDINNNEELECILNLCI